MKENQNWATFDDNEKDEFWNRAEFKWDNKLHTENYIHENGFENENEFVASPIVSFNESKSLKEIDSYTDKNITEFELPELEVFYQENPVKDICIDDGVSSKEEILINRENCKCETTLEGGVESLSLEESKYLSKNECGGVVGYDNEVKYIKSDEIVDDEVLTVKPVADNNSSLEKTSKLKSLKTLFDSLSSDGSDIEHLSDQIIQPKTTSETPAVSGDDVSKKGISDISYDSKIEDRTITFDFNSIKLESEGIDEKLDNQDNTHEQAVKLNGLPTHDGTKSNNILNDENKIKHGLGESSFSMAGPVSGLISYSGSIVPFSGSISIRSDSSTTSTRSFAFPILPNEWNSSPVRMAKADRRQYRRDKGWRNGLFCCRF